jgi:acyl carrier protein
MSTLERVSKVFSEVFEWDAQLSRQTAPEDVTGWDSLGHLKLVSGLEEEFGVRLEVDDIMEMTSVGRILDIVGRLSAPQRAAV